MGQSELMQVASFVQVCQTDFWPRQALADASLQRAMGMLERLSVLWWLLLGDVLPCRQLPLLEANGTPPIP